LAVRPGLAEVTELLVAGAEPTRYSSLAARWTGNPADLPAVRDGRAGVQDEGSQLVTIALAAAAAPRGRWLDLCAGPGGKTALLAGLTDPPDPIVAVDIAPHRAALVRRAVRAYPKPPTVLVADGTRPAWRRASFVRVLADVPCTGLGALRRRPEARWRRQPGDVEQLHDLQLALLDSAIDSACPGGVVGYVTCSPHRRETIDVVTETLAERNDVEVIPAAGLLPESLDAALTGDFVQLWPHRHGTDAMFAAYLRCL
jgi:16S rRNA (cytosine967-C5)-methyltransferase